MCQRKETRFGIRVLEYRLAVRSAFGILQTMRRLDRYIFREVLVPTLIGVVALSFVWFSRQIGGLLETFIRQAATAREVLDISAAILPNVLTITIPMAILVGILTGFGRMSSDNEAIALRSVGVPMRRVVRPVLLLASLA